MGCRHITWGKARCLTQQSTTWNRYKWPDWASPQCPGLPQRLFFLSNIREPPFRSALTPWSISLLGSIGIIQKRFMLTALFAVLLHCSNSPGDSDFVSVKLLKSIFLNCAFLKVTFFPPILLRSVWFLCTLGRFWGLLFHILNLNWPLMFRLHRYVFLEASLWYFLLHFCYATLLQNVFTVSISLSWFPVQNLNILKSRCI